MNRDHGRHARQGKSRDPASCNDKDQNQSAASRIETLTDAPSYLYTKLCPARDVVTNDHTS